MTSNPSQPAPDPPGSGAASSEPLTGLPLAEDGFPARDDRWHTGPLDPWHTGPQGGRPGGGRWAVPGPGPAAGRPGSVPGGRAGEQLTAAREGAGPADPGDEHLAVLSYLSVPFLGPLVPFLVYLVRKRASGYVRSQSVQALNLSVTALIYTFCALVLGGMLALDSVTVALVVVVPLAVGLWLATLTCVILAAFRASQGGYFQIPGWFCATILR